MPYLPKIDFLGNKPSPVVGTHYWEALVLTICVSFYFFDISCTLHFFVGWSCYFPTLVFMYLIIFQ